MNIHHTAGTGFQEPVKPIGQIVYKKITVVIDAYTDRTAAGRALFIRDLPAVLRVLYAFVMWFLQMVFFVKITHAWVKLLGEEEIDVLL